MSQCKCGYLDDASLGCGHAPKCAREYQSKISGPLFDRIDLHADVPAVSPADLSLPPARETSAQVAARVTRVRGMQRERYEVLHAGDSVCTNSQADGDLLEKVAAPDAAGRQLLTEAAERLRLSTRGHHRVLRVARTLADMDASDAVKRVHVAEALSYRRIAVSSA